MASISTTAVPLEPYKNFKFRVKWDNKYVAGMTKVSTLSRITEVIDFREGGDPSNVRRLPGQTRYEPIALERGLTIDAEFDAWANQVWKLQAKDEISIKDFRKNILIEMFNEAGQLALTMKVYRCWVSEYNATPELDSSGNAVAIESLKLQNEGWVREVPSTPASGA